MATDTNQLLLITSAAGIQGRHLVPRLIGKISLRLVVNSQKSVDKLMAQFPSADVVRADMAEPADCQRIVQGATCIYHVGPSLHPHESEIGYNMVDAAVNESQRTGHFKHFIYSSVLNTQLRKMFNHDRKRYVEEYLFESGLNYTVLNPGDFIDMPFPVKLFKELEEPVWKVIISPETKSSFVVLEDLAEASEKVIMEGEKHYQAQYPLCSMPPTAYGDVAAAVSEAIGKELKIQRQTVEESTDTLLGLLFGDPATATARQRDGAERLVLFYRRRGLQGNPNVMRWLLGREPTSYREYIARELQ